MALHIIYKLTSPSGKCYIGQTKNKLEVRLKQHIQAMKRYKKNPEIKNTSRKLYEGMIKYDISLWTKEILCEVSSDDINDKEIYYIELFNSVDNGYNISRGGLGNNVEYLTEEHRENLSKSRLEYYETDEGKLWKEKLTKKYSGENNPMYGTTYNHTEETKKKISKNSKGKNLGKEPWNKNKTGVYTEETKKKISTRAKENHKKGKYDYAKMGEMKRGFKQPESQKQKVAEKLSKRWLVTNPDGESFEVINLQQFCRENNLHNGNMVSVSKGKLNHYKKWKCKLLE